MNKQKIINTMVNISSGIEDFLHLAAFSLRIGPKQTVRLFQEFPWLIKGLQLHKLYKYTHRSLPYSREIVHFIFQYMIQVFETYVKHPDRLIWFEELLTPEIPLAMGFTPFMPEAIGLFIPLVKNSIAEGYIDATENEGYPADMCSFIKTSLGLVLKNQLPAPRLILTTNAPCDSAMAGYTPIEEKYGVPVFRLDQLYETNEKSVAYYARSLWKMIDFLEETTGVKMDFDRLRDICEERNKQSDYIVEFRELNRTRPAPAGAAGLILSILGHSLMPGSKLATKFAKKFRDESQKRFRNKIGSTKTERIRYVMWGVPFETDAGIYEWMEETYGASMVAEMYSSRSYSFIDTSTPDSMLLGLAKDMMRGPMSKHTRGPARNYYEELIRLVKEYNADMVLLGAHMGCKSGSAIHRIVHDKLKEKGIPCLTIQFDVTDTRVVSPADIRRQVSQFMEVIMKV